MNQTWAVRVTDVHQRYIDQARSMNLHVTNDYAIRQLLNLYVLTWEDDVRTLCYMCSKSLEAEECENYSSQAVSEGYVFRKGYLI